MSFHASCSNTRPSQDRAFQPRNTAFANETTARCKHCSKMIPVDSMEEHETFFCPLKPIRCQHFKANGEMCGFVCSGIDALRDHCKTCKDHPRKRRSVSIRESGSPRCASDRCADLCDDCQRVFPDRASLTEHQRVCPLKSVPCPLHCGVWMQRKQVPDHILETAIKHKPLRRPSVADYGADNIHMVVAVLMEALQNAKKALQQQKAICEETLSNVDLSVSFRQASPRRSLALVEESATAEAVNAAPPASESPMLQNSFSLCAVGSVESNGLPADAAISASASASASAASSSEGRLQKIVEIDEAANVDADGNLVAPASHNALASPRIKEENQDAAHLSSEATTQLKTSTGEAAPAAEQRALRPRKRKTSTGATKGRRKSSTASATALPPPPPAKALFCATPSAATCQPSKVRYEDFVLKSPARAVVCAKSPPRTVRLRPACSHLAVSPRAQPLLNGVEVSPRSQPPQSPSTVSPCGNRS